MEDLNRKLAEKVEEIQDIEDLNQTLILRDHMSNQELQDLRKELINVSLPWLTKPLVHGNSQFMIFVGISISLDNLLYGDPI